MSYAPPPYASPPTAQQPSYVGSVLMIVFGGLLIPIGIIAGVTIGVVSLAAGVSDYIDSAEYLYGPTDVQMTAGERGTISASADHYSASGDPVTCAVTGPDGDVPLESITASRSSNDTTYLALYTFDVNTTGAYTIDCGNVDAELLPWEGLFPGYVAVAGIIAAAVAIGVPIIGLVLLIVGIVKCVGVSKKRRAMFPPGGGYPPAGGYPGFYSQVPGDPRQ